MINTVSVLGSTGSVGIQTLSVVSMLGLKVIALTAHSNAELLYEQMLVHKPDYVVLTDHSAYLRFIGYPSNGAKVLFGKEGLEEAASLKADMVYNSVVGFAGLSATFSALLAGNELALANKESIVAMGEKIMRIARSKNIRVIPVDSEHSAIYQCLQCGRREDVSEIILTASGGALRDHDADKLSDVTVEQVLAHPNWNMGRKITVDSATMMNKGLEVIEAKHLFGMPEEKIRVIIHRESIIHSLVGFKDGSYIAQMGYPDMRVPIMYAATCPERAGSDLPALDLATISKLTFSAPDMQRYRCLSLAYEALKHGGSMTTAMNAANEIAVEAFLAGKLRYTKISEIIERVMEKHDTSTLETLDDAADADSETRRIASILIGGN